jgi:hypothetical protein
MPRQLKPPKQPSDRIIDRYALMPLLSSVERLDARLLAENPEAGLPQLPRPRHVSQL